jgi:murein DD-endopeptidase MepM/ murein hydrolase activator NlpD
MADQDEGSGGKPPSPPSFDPHTWFAAEGGEPAPDEPAAAVPEVTSFDPKTWIKPEPEDAEPPSPPPPPNRRGLIIAGAGLFVASGGAGIWALQRRRPSPRVIAGKPPATDLPPSPPVPPAPPTDPQAPDAGSKVLLDADSLQHLKIQLSYGYHLSDREAGRLTDALTDALGGERGKLHVVMLMNAATGSKAGDDQVRWLTARGVNGVGVRLDRVEDDYTVTAVSSALTTRACATRFGQMNDQSFYSSATSVFHDDLLIAQFVAAMAYDFNFAHEVAPGSRFQGVFEEQRDADGNLIGPRRLKRALLNTRAIDDEVDFQGAKRARHVPAKSRKLYLFDAGRDGRAAWYDQAGASAVRGLMRTPVEGARVTSKFGPRIHPIFETVKVHAGVDFGCPIGTPVFAAADGVVAMAGPVRGYGNYLRLSHGPHMWTAYGHLSAYPATTVEGARVVQGQVVAFTGNTGNSTGPHLHYEIRVDGEPVDPLTFQTTQTRTLAGAQLEAFLVERDRIDAAGSECT